jgi:hypothetical protein
MSQSEREKRETGSLWRAPSQRASERAVIALLFIAAAALIHPSTTSARAWAQRAALWARVNDYLVKSRPQVRRPIFLPCILYKGVHCWFKAARGEVDGQAPPSSPYSLLEQWCCFGARARCMRGALLLSGLTRPPTHPPPVRLPTSSFYRPAPPLARCVRAIFLVLDLSTKFHTAGRHFWNYPRWILNQPHQPTVGNSTKCSG